MLKIKYPEQNFRIKEEGNKNLIFDEIRKRWVFLTPEEWVRQNFLQYLVVEKKYPKSLIAVERGIKVNSLQKRCDIIIYKNDKPFVVVECKEPNEQLNENVLMQLLRYNMQLQVPYLIITNGSYTYGWKIENSITKEITEVPEFIYL